MKNNSSTKLKQTVKVREAYEDMLIRIAVTAEYKDPGAGGHISRVSDYSTAIARSFGMPEDEVEVLRDR